MVNKRKTSLPPGHINTEQAIQILNVTRTRLYQLVDEGRLHPYKIGNAFMFKTAEIEQFSRNPAGRRRAKSVAWRAYKSGVKVLATEIDVQVRAGKQQQLLEMLQNIQKNNRHTFFGTIARYVLRGDEGLNSIHMLLVWKDTEMPVEEVHQGYLAIFQEELADVLDWETAKIQMTDALMYT